MQTNVIFPEAKSKNFWKLMKNQAKKNEMLRCLYITRSVVFMDHEEWKKQRLKSCVCVGVKGPQSVSHVPGNPAYQAAVLALYIFPLK